MQKKILLLFLVATALHLAGCSPDAPHLEVQAPTSTRYVLQGKELVHGLAACTMCHGQQAKPLSPLVGGREQKDIYGPVKAANLTPHETGLKDWTALDFFRAMRGAENPDGELLSAEIHAGYEWMADEDLLSIAAYLRSLPPVENEVERRTISTFDRNTVGVLEYRGEVKGYVPLPERRFPEAYGKYLTDHVARCGFCHNSAGSLVEDPEYLGGGKIIRTGEATRLAPSILPIEPDGIGGWKKDEIVRYLQTGQTPEGRQVDVAACPIPFYANARHSNLEAIAIYLKSIPVTQ